MILNVKFAYTPSGEFTLEGIAAAKAAGYTRGRQRQTAYIEVDTKAFESVYNAWKAGEVTAKKAMQKLGLKPNTFYRRVKKFESGE